MLMSVGEGTGTDIHTVRGRNYPSIRQFTVFLENRVGQLLEVIRRFEGSKVRIVALSIVDSAECAFVRFLLSHPEQGREILERAGLALIESDLIGVELGEGPQPQQPAVAGQQQPAQQQQQPQGNQPVMVVNGVFEGSDLQRALMDRDYVRRAAVRTSVPDPGMYGGGYGYQQPLYPFTVGLNGYYPGYGYPGWGWGAGWWGWGGTTIIINKKHGHHGGGGWNGLERYAARIVGI